MEDKMQLFIEEVKDMKEWQEFLLDNKNNKLGYILYIKENWKVEN